MAHPSMKNRLLSARDEVVDFTLGAMMFGWHFVIQPALIGGGILFGGLGAILGLLFLARLLEALH